MDVLERTWKKMQRKIFALKCELPPIPSGFQSALQCPIEAPISKLLLKSLLISRYMNRGAAESRLGIRANRSRILLFMCALSLSISYRFQSLSYL